MLEIQCWQEFRLHVSVGFKSLWKHILALNWKFYLNAVKMMVVMIVVRSMSHLSVHDFDCCLHPVCIEPVCST